MSYKDAIKAIQLDGLHIEAKADRFLEFSQGLLKAEEALKFMSRIGSINHICLHCKHNQPGDCETINALNCPFGDFEKVTE